MKIAGLLFITGVLLAGCNKDNFRARFEDGGFMGVNA